MSRLLVLSLLLSALAACTTAEVLDCPYSGEPASAPSAGCLVVVHGSVLMVDNRFGGVSPPGGTALDGEAARCTAQRETREETGLDLEPGPLLWTFDTGFELYRCDIHAGSGDLREPGWEIRRVFWLPLGDFESVDWRYPEQGAVIRDIVTGQDPDEEGK